MKFEIGAAVKVTRPRVFEPGDPGGRPSMFTGTVMSVHSDYVAVSLDEEFVELFSGWN